MMKRLTLERREEENLRAAASPHTGAGTLFTKDALAVPDVLTTQRTARSVVFACDA